MLDSRTALLLRHINALCADDNYKIVEKTELLGAFPAALAPSAAGLDGMLEYLKENGYVDVRYADRQRGVYCLLPLPAGRLYAEQALLRRAESAAQFRKILLASLGGSFAGALLGAGMAAALIAFIA